MTDHILPVYARLPVDIVRGEGVWLFDDKGNKYLDCIAGIGVSSLGYKHPIITQTIKDQADKLLHISNLVEIPQQRELSDVLVEKLGSDARVFFANCGSTAVETAIKLVRLYGHSKNIASPKTIVMDKAFHGRTSGAVAAGGSAKVRDGFEPYLEGFVHVPFNDIAAIEAAIKADKDIVAIMLEPIQGEGGINVPGADYLNKIRDICDKHGLLMILDEIQAGMGRTGKFFCFEHNKIKPDVVLLAKALANGIPIGACIIAAPYYELFKPGQHGSTFGGNPMSCAVALATIKEMTEGGWIENATRQGDKIIAGLKKALANNKNVVEVRGKGLMIGIELDRPSRELLPIALKHNILCNVAGTHAVRLLPPMIFQDEHSEMIIDLMPKIIEEFCASS